MTPTFVIEELTSNESQVALCCSDVALCCSDIEVALCCSDIAALEA